MAFNGSGTYNLPAGNPVVTGTTISSSWANTTLSDIATALSNCITRDGQSPATANLPMSSHKLTGLAAGTTAGDSVRYEQVTSALAATGGTIDGVVIGGTTAAAGSFTTLSASNTISGTGFSNYLASPPAIGGTTPAAGSFTTLSASSTVTLSGGTANGVLYLNGSKAVTSGSGLVFDGSNLGLGVTPSAWAGVVPIQSTYGALAGNAQVNITANAYYNSGWKYIGTGVATQYLQNSGVHSWYTAVSGSAGGTISFSESMRIDSSGNVGIGTSSPGSNGKLSVVALSGGNAVSMIGRSSDGYARFQAWDRSATTPTGSVAFIEDGTITFNRSNTGSQVENMRIDSFGSLLVGQTTNPSTSSIVVKVPTITGNGVNAQITSNTGTSYPWANYNASGTYIGGISCTSSATSFPTSSDQRLKTDKGIATDTSVIDQTVVHDFEWKIDGSVDRGVFAQEAYEIKPNAVNKGTDEVNEDGFLKQPWGVDYSKYVPDLIVYCQQLRKELDELKSNIH